MVREKNILFKLRLYIIHLEMSFLSVVRKINNVAVNLTLDF